MDHRRKEIMKRIEKRKKINQTQAYSTGKKEPRVNKNINLYPEYQEQHDFAWYNSNEGSGGEKGHPLFSKEKFIFKVLVSAVLVLVMAFIYKSPSQQWEPVRTAVENIMEREFQFAAVSNWYETTFGKPLALFPEKQTEEETNVNGYAQPANGIILEEFESDNQGVMIQTLKDESVESIQAGMVKFAGVDEKFGNTVIVQNNDLTETWYGHLGEIKVKEYEIVKAGDELGVVSSSDNETTGEFYFAIKKDEKFIDPVQVINFE